MFGPRVGLMVWKSSLLGSKEKIDTPVFSLRLSMGSSLKASLVWNF